MTDGVEQRDAADEGWLEPGGSTLVCTVIVSEGKVVHPSQLIASVMRSPKEVTARAPDLLPVWDARCRGASP
jgi:hypothetical protein